MLRVYNSREKKEKRIARAKAGARARWDNYSEDMPPRDAEKPLPDKRYTLIFIDHIISKEYVFTLHKGKRKGSFRIDVNGQPFRDGGWSKVLEEIRKKRIRIESMKNII